MNLTEAEFYAGDVRRWHASQVPELRDCGDTIQSHQVRCVWLVKRLITAPERTLIEATRWHDQPEVLLGDMPFLTKRDFPNFAAAWETMECFVVMHYNVPQPTTQTERDMVKLVDLLDAYMIVQKHAPHILDEPDWQEQHEEISRRARALDMLRGVLDIIREGTQ